MIYLFLIAIFLSPQIYAQNMEMLEKTITVTSPDKNPVSSKKSLQEIASIQVSEEMIRDIIGSEKFEKNKKQIRSKIINQSARYIPLIKTTDFVEDVNEVRGTVVLKISMKELNTLLQDNGLLVENEGSGVILPLVSIVDRVNMKSYRWWQDDSVESHSANTKSMLIHLSQAFENSARVNFFKSGFYLIKPMQQRLNQQVPLDKQVEHPMDADLLFFGKTFRANFVIDGQVILLPGGEKSQPHSYIIEVKMTVVQIVTGNVVARLMRRFETESGLFEQVVQKKIVEGFETISSDLVLQVKDLWQRGAIGTKSIRLTINGLMSIVNRERFKEQLKTMVPQIRKMRERLILSNSLTYEIDSNLSVAELFSKLNNMKMMGRGFQKEGSDGQSITVRLSNL